MYIQSALWITSTNYKIKPCETFIATVAPNIYAFFMIVFLVVVIIVVVLCMYKKKKACFRNANNANKQQGGEASVDVVCLCGHANYVVLYCGNSLNVDTLTPCGGIGRIFKEGDSVCRSKLC